jgi:hypothetical protein
MELDRASLALGLPIVYSVEEGVARAEDRRHNLSILRSVAGEQRKMGENSSNEAVAVSPIVARSKQCVLALQRLEAKKAIVGQLIDGRLHLLEAANRFQEIGRSAGANSASESSAGEEYWCRAVIGWVCLALSERPERADALAAQLEAELATYLRKPAAAK